MILADNPPVKETKSTIPAIIQKTINEDIVDIEFPIAKPAKIDIIIISESLINQFES